jgi:phosphoribosylpyrophosphate synthetase
VVTDTVSGALPASPHIDICSVAPLLATAIRRNHREESLADLRPSA